VQSGKNGKRRRRAITIGSKARGSGTKVPKKKSTSKRQIVQIIKPLSGALLK
jgi:hypothetical protein